MKYFFRMLMLLGSAVLLAVSSNAQTGKQNRSPVINHQPATVAVQGQPITVLAKVTDDSTLVKSVTLFYSLSKDAAPFRSPMKSTGGGMYYGSIPSSIMANADSVLYYIEALDNLDATTETPWYTVALKSSAPEQAAQRAPAPSVAPAKTQRSGSNWAGAALIGGGAAVVLGGAFLLSEKNSDSSSDNGDGGNGGVQTGVYTGTVDERFTSSAGSSNTAHAMTITIDENGVVRSDTIRSGSSFSAQLNDNSFTWIADLSSGTGSNAITGQIQYEGTVAGTEIVGNISGSVVENPTTTGYYSGTFQAQKQ